MNIFDKDTVLQLFLKDVLERHVRSKRGLQVNGTPVTRYHLKTAYDTNDWTATLHVNLGPRQALTLKHTIPLKHMHNQKGRHLYQLAENTVEQLLSNY